MSLGCHFQCWRKVSYSACIFTCLYTLRSLPLRFKFYFYSSSITLQSQLLATYFQCPYSITWLQSLKSFRYLHQRVSLKLAASMSHFHLSVSTISYLFCLCFYAISLFHPGSAWPFTSYSSIQFFPCWRGLHHPK